jgi:hypothetical protein
MTDDQIKSEVIQAKDDGWGWGWTTDCTFYPIQMGLWEGKGGGGIAFNLKLTIFII